MRVKTEGRRLSIMQAAAEVFREQGFAGASMAAIAARVGGSKATLYNYFSSKEELFIAVTLSTMDETGDAMLELLHGDVRDIRATLIAFGHAYLKLLLNPDVLTTTRIGTSLGLPEGLGQSLYESGPERGWRAVATDFERFTRMGVLNTPNPTLAALQFKSLLESGSFEPMLFGKDPIFDRQTLIEAAVDTFLARYA